MRGPERAAQVTLFLRDTRPLYTRICLPHCDGGNNVFRVMGPWVGFNGKRYLSAYLSGEKDIYTESSQFAHLDLYFLFGKYIFPIVISSRKKII